MVREGGLVGGGVEDGARDEPACGLPEDDISVCVWVRSLNWFRKIWKFFSRTFGATQKPSTRTLQYSVITIS